MSAPVTAPPQPAAVPGRGPVVQGAPRVPQVNLLPPEIRAARSLGRVKRLLVLVLVSVVAVAGLGYFFALNEVSQAQAELTREQDETRRLIAAQAEYAEVPQVLSALDAVRRSREIGSSTEVMWRSSLESLVLTAPPGVGFETITMTSASPMFAASLPTSPLVEPTPITIHFTGRSLLIPDTAAWIEALEEIEHFQDAYVTSASITEEDEDGVMTAYYEIDGTVQVAQSAFALRFAEAPADAEGE